MTTNVPLHEMHENNHLELFSLIWLDVNVDAQKNKDTETKLRLIINHIKKFDNADECKIYIEQIAKDDLLVVLVSGQLGRQIVPSIHQHRQVLGIYINSEDNDSDKQWAYEFPKLKWCVDDELDELISQINEDHISRKKMEKLLWINVFTTTTDAGKSTTGVNGQFLFSQLVINCLLRLKPNEMDKNELISCFEKEYRGNQLELDHLRKFQKNYSPDKVLWWYTRESFFYRTLNASLYKQNIHMMFLYRSFINDIYHQLQHYQSKSPVRVYRYQLMSIDELSSLQKSIGQFVSVNSFLSTSTQRQITYIYLNDSNQKINLEPVFFEIDADPKVAKERPFADITQWNQFPLESKVLFMPGSIFRLHSIDRDDRHIWIVKMSLCGDGEHSLKHVLGDIKKQIGIEESNLCTLGKMLWKIGKLDLAKMYYNRCLSELSDNDPLFLTAYEDLADITSQLHDYDEFVYWRQKLLNFKDRISSNDTHKKGEIIRSLYHSNAKRIPVSIRMATFLY
ncbi:unnamed protein product [Rotaria magnacalcarata]|uniref:Uncharacterized protein n=1 Tax=Rotaria magnacalcarata TaxID=392030 RepID=A0A816KYY9_9BILA|nr:unnamed protein product [Rotaria magnacalcarata]CAF4040664.1 unnamed protein product [Rotaria magnacalcarata]